MLRQNFKTALECSTLWEVVADAGVSRTFRERQRDLTVRRQTPSRDALILADP
jgi:hypothetical protein